MDVVEIHTQPEATGEKEEKSEGKSEGTMDPKSEVVNPWLDDSLMSFNVEDEKKMENENGSPFTKCRSRYTSDLTVNGSVYIIYSGTHKKKLIHRIPTTSMVYNRNEIYFASRTEDFKDICAVGSIEGEIILYTTIAISDDVGYRQRIGISKCNITKLVEAKVKNKIYSANSSAFMEKLNKVIKTSELDFQINVHDNNMEIQYLSLKLMKTLDYIEINLNENPNRRNKFLQCFNNPRSAIINRMLLVLSLATIALCWWIEVEGFSFLDALYFCLETVSTVGYGDQDSFTYHGSQIFNTVFILIGVLLVFNVLDYLISQLTNVNHSVAAKIKKPTKSENLKHEIEKSVKTVEQKKSEKGWILNSVPWPFLFFLVLGLIVFTQVEFVGGTPLFNEKLGNSTNVDGARKLYFLEAVYFSIVTCTSVGYGDIYAQNQEGKLFTGFWLLFILITFAKAVSNAVNESSEKKQKKKNDRILAHAFRIEEDFEVFDTHHGNNVSKAEFVVQMIKKLNLVDTDDVADILSMYDAIDTDNSGTIGMGKIKTFLGHQHDAAYEA